MQYKIVGEPLPVVICDVSAGESLITEKGAMSWMSPNMKMETQGTGGFGKMMGRMFSGESMFQNKYTAQGGPGQIAFASSFPGTIKPFYIEPGKEIIVQKSGFLASEASVELSVFFQKKFGSGLFGGEGFIMQRLSGHGTAFVEIDGATVEYTLAPGQKIIVDTGYIAVMDATCTIDIQGVGGIKNALLGGEGLFNTVVTGPGKILLQTMPINSVAAAINPFIATGN
ncbi:MAG: TIGR00266 family protein [Eubacterium sp.]|nr:TIGR00266 family protein [Eubacterium sp.]